MIQLKNSVQSQVFRWKLSIKLAIIFKILNNQRKLNHNKRNKLKRLSNKLSKQNNSSNKVVNIRLKIINNSKPKLIKYLLIIKIILE